MGRDVAPAVRFRSEATAARITPGGQTSQSERTTVLTPREAFVESAPRHYDRVPGAGLKGGDASRRETAGSRWVGGVMSATAFRSRPRPERETEA